MKINQIKFSESVTIAGRPDTFFKAEDAALRGTKVSIEDHFIKFEPKEGLVTLVPLVKVNYITLSKDKKVSEKTSTKSETLVNGGSTTK